MRNILLALILTLTLTACGGGQVDPTPAAAQAQRVIITCHDSTGAQVFAADVDGASNDGGIWTIRIGADATVLDSAGLECRTK